MSRPGSHGRLAGPPPRISAAVKHPTDPRRGERRRGGDRRAASEGQERMAQHGAVALSLRGFSARLWPPGSHSPHISTVTYFSALDKFRSVPTTRQGGVLARTHEGEPGLPRGRNGLPPETVRAAQRERLLRSVIAAVAATGFSDVTVADIVRGARVSKAAFYAHFADKEDCFLAATREGGHLMINRVKTAARSQPPGTPAEAVLRASLAAFLDFLAREPAFARAFYIDMPAAGPRAARRIRSAHHSFA